LCAYFPYPFGLAYSRETYRADIRSESILDFPCSENIERLGQNGFEIHDARVYAMQGKPDQSLNAIRDAIATAFHCLWRYITANSIHCEHRLKFA